MTTKLELLDKMTQQLRVFANDLLRAFLKAGFEVVEEPYVDYALHGFRATYIRRYLFQKHSPFSDGILTTFIHVVGLPFGQQSQKMVILSTPRNIKSEPISETLKLRVHFDENGLPYVVHNDHQHQHQQQSTAKLDSNCNYANVNKNTTFDSYLNESLNLNQSYQQQKISFPGLDCNTIGQFAHDLSNYVSHIIEIISPGLIQLPIEMKLEILKKLSVDSIIKMSQVNNEFKSLIFNHGESLWRHLCYRDFKIKIINRSIHKSWMELYRDSYIVHQVEVCRKERALPGLPERPALPPAPYMLQIEWLPHVLALPLYPPPDY